MMKRPTETIANLLTIEGATTDFDVYVNINGTDIVVIANADVRHHLWEHYYEWNIFTKGDTLSAKYMYLVYSFGEYCKEMRNSFNRIYAALTQEYDPTGDYSRHETTAYKLTHEVEYGKTSTNTAEDYESKIEYNSDVGDEVSTDGTPASLRDHTRTSKGGYDTTTLNGSITTELSGTDTVTDTREAADNVKLIEGNNRSPQSAINDEITLRIHHDFTDIVMGGFADKYLFLCAEG